MATITSLVQFFEQSQVRFRVFDLGRRVLPLGPQLFAEFEQGQRPYPYPLQRQAWLGFLGWPGDDAARHFIWFLRLPLDEQGHLAYAARDDLLTRLVELAQAGLEGAATAQPLADYPYGFKPADERLAAFHAQALKLLGLPPSRYYPHARDYLRGANGFDQWATVGLQGIADVAARLDEDDNTEHLARALPQLPAQPFEALAKGLENQALPTHLSAALARLIEAELSQPSPDPRRLALGLRALALAPAAGRRPLLLQALTDPAAGDLNLLVSIAGRCWEDLEDPAVCTAFLEALANNPHGQEVFDQVLADLFFIPGMRPPLMAALRQPGRSATLGAAVGQFFSAFKPA